MKSRKNLLKKSRLYLILDKPRIKKVLSESYCRKICSCGIGMVQLRDKTCAKIDLLKPALKLARCFRRSKTLFIVNDYPDLALLSGADGVHLGQDDMPLEKARQMLGRNRIIGISCHNLRQAISAQKQGADYIGIGPVYTSDTKPGASPIGLKALKQLKGRIKIPYFAIGDINKNNAASILLSGCRRMAVCRAILDSGDIRVAAKGLLKELQAK